MATWLINGSSPESLGLAVVSWDFHSGRASSVRLARVSAFDATEILAYGAAVTITRDGSAFFKGKCRVVSKSGSGEGEGQDYLVEDAWADLERTTYQEAWGTTSGSVDTPLVILGVNESGTRIALGDQIEAAVSYAIASGVSLTLGSVPTGMMLWPTEANGVSCAEVIRECLRYHPDWLPWIDHSTTPPTFNVTPRADATARSLAVTDCDTLDVVKTDERLPDCVRIVYQTADQVGDDIKRKISVDKYPALGADSGPGVLSTVVDLQGVKATIQKQQVQTRTIPTAAASDADKKAWMKLNFPALATLADADFDVAAWTVTLIAETETAPDPINPNATPLRGPTVSLTASDIPRQLVKGSVHEWMRCKVGRVRIDWYHAETGTATEAEVKLLNKVPMGITVTATNATTKIYKGISSWEAAASAPSGVAQAYYETITNGCQYQGSVTLTETEINPSLYHGAKLNLTSGVTGWATMAAPIHRLAWDLQSGRTVIDFGPTPDYSVQDFLEYLRLLNQRPANWMSSAERTSDELGDAAGASSAGDAVGPFDTSKEMPEFETQPASTTGPFRLTARDDLGTLKWKVSSVQSSITDGTNGDAIDLSSAGFDTDTTITATKYIILEASVDADLAITSWALAAVDAGTDNVNITEVRFTTSGTIRQDKIRLLIGKVTVVSGVATASQAVFTPQMITHGLTNGVAVKCFLGHAINPADI